MARKYWSARNAIGNYHGPRLTAELALRQYLVVEVVNHNLGLETYGVFVALNETPQVTRTLSVADGGLDLGVLPDRSTNLLIEDTAVGDHDNGIKYCATVTGRRLTDRSRSGWFTRAPGRRGTDQTFQTLFAGVGGHSILS